MTAAVLVLALVTLQRLGELVLAGRNTRRLKAAGAREFGAAHYPLVVLLHAAWLVGLWWLAWDAPVHWPWLAAFGALQLLRVWVIATLGRRWTTRIIVPRAEPPVRRGPYRFLRHPNYAVVAAEIPVLPFAFGLTLYGVVFTLLNCAVLAVRIRAEDRALASNGAPP